MIPSSYAVVTTRAHRRPRGFTLSELRTFVAADRVAQVDRNAAAMRRVAAGLPRCVIPPGQCPVHNQRGGRPGQGDRLTTSTRSGGLSGSIQSA